MWKRIIHFVQYHNFFTIAVMALFVGASASFAASPDLQKSVLAKTDVVRSVDNTFLVNTDFDTYDMGLKITAVTQDTDTYYIDYTYNTIVQNDYVWQPTPVTDSMKISKKELAGRDLGLYVAEELGQLVTQQVGYLKEVQTREKEKGASQKVIATEYSGLVGRFLGTEEQTFEGYTPVKPPPPVEIAQSNEPDMSGAAAIAAIPSAVDSNGLSLTSYGASVTGSPVVTRDQLQAIIQDTVRQLLAGGTATTTATSTPPSSPPPSSTPPPADTTPPPSETTPPPVATTTPPVTPPTEPVATTTLPAAPVEPIATTTPLVVPVEPVATTTATTTPA